MQYIDLFGGIGGFRHGIEKATKRKWKCIWYCDNDKYATQTYNKNFKESHQAADIREIRNEDIPEHDLICAGFPCQAFSIAGKRLGFDDTRGTLFYEILRIARHHRTKYLFLENVKGLLSHDEGRTFATILASLNECGYNAQWQVLNSKHFGVPQNRERIFIIANLRGEPRPKVFPIGLNAGEVQEVSGETAKTLRARDYKGTPSPKYYYEKGEYNLINVPMVHSLYPRSSKTNKGGVGHLTRNDDASFCVDCGNMQAVSAIKVKQINPSKESGGKQPYQQNRIYNKDGLSPALPSELGGDRSHLINTMKLRRLTPIECERLQSFPDYWTAEGINDNGEVVKISDTQRYKMCGNAVTTNVIEAIVESWIANIIPQV